MKETLTITIELESPSFRNGNGEQYEGPEVARLLRKYAGLVEECAEIPPSIFLIDINGNAVGEAYSR